MVMAGGCSAADARAREIEAKLTAAGLDELQVAAITRELAKLDSLIEGLCAATDADDADFEAAESALMDGAFAAALVIALAGIEDDDLLDDLLPDDLLPDPKDCP